MSEPIVTNLAKIWEDENQIMHILFFQRAELTKEDIEEYVKSCVQLSGGKQSLVLTDFSNISYFAMGALKKIIGPELTRITKASAVLVKPSSPIVLTGISFLLKIEKEPFPIKVFTDEKEATNWLLSMKN